MSDLALALGAAVIKAAVKLWAGGNPLGDELADGLTDLIKGRVSGAVDRRKVRRQFDQMEEFVADQVLAVMSEEFRDLPEGERYAAIAAVTETISRARLTDRVLFEGNLDPLYLERFFRRFIVDATRDLSAGGLQLFDRVLAQCSAYVIEIADKLPRFQAGAFTELLRRDSQILGRLEEVIERMPAPVGDDSPHGRVEVAYRQRVAKQFDRLEFFGLDFASQWYALSVAYVSLSVSVQQAPVAGVRGKAPQRDLSRQLRPGPFEHWLAACPRLLIDGRAGGGKTTILQWIAVRAARRDLTGSAAELNGLVPFYIRLRDYVGRQLPQPEQFLDKVAPLLAPEAGDWPRKQLFGGRAIVLVDGVDEVPEAQRREVVQWLRDLTDFFPQSRYVVTTRPGAIGHGALEEAGFTQAILEPMNPALVRQFIGQWHAAMREWHKDDEAIEQLMHYRDKLLRALDNDRFLSELANTPLLAGLICALNQHLGGQLPRRRGEIFERALAMFHERDRRRGIEGDVKLDLSATNHLLGDLALWMVRNAAIEVAEDTASGVLARSASSLPSAAGQGKLYRYLLLRSGVLREPATGHVDFVHRSFQEYLGAKALITADNVGEILRNAADDQWREVVILAVGQANTRQATDLLRGLMQANFRGNHRYRRRLLAIASLDEIHGADPDVLSVADQSIPDLLPPKTLDEAEALSHAGERLLPYLESHLPAMSGPKVSNPGHIQAVIRAASLIGGPRALNLIAAIGQGAPARSDARMLDEEFTRAWDYFGAAGYAEGVLLAAGINEIVVNSRAKLAELVGVPGVRAVDLAGWVVDGTDLAVLDDVQVPEVCISRSSITHFAEVARRWPSVKRVKLIDLPGLNSIDALMNLAGLEELEIINCGTGRRVWGNGWITLGIMMNLKRFYINSGEVQYAYPETGVPGS